MVGCSTGFIKFKVLKCSNKLLFTIVNSVLVENGPCLVAFVRADVINGSEKGDSSSTSCVMVAMEHKINLNVL